MSRRWRKKRGCFSRKLRQVFARPQKRRTKLINTYNNQLIRKSCKRRKRAKDGSDLIFIANHKNKEMSRPISRVLSWAIIHLGCESLRTSSNLPGSNAGHASAPLFGLAPSGVYLAIACYHRCGALLPHHFNLTGPKGLGGIFSAALSVGLHPPGVTWHSALWSPDFPQYNECTAIAWSARGVFYR